MNTRAGQNLLGTKADTLSRLSPLLRKSHILPLVSFTYDQWKEDPNHILTCLFKNGWAADSLIVRSSRTTEDSEGQSQAGAYKSICGLMGYKETADAIRDVFDSYEAKIGQDQVLVQPELRNMIASGVACLCDPNSGAPYRVVNWTTQPQNGSVTSGNAPNMKTWYLVSYHTRSNPPAEFLTPLVYTMDELHHLVGHDRIETEFGISELGHVVIFQVRALPNPPRVSVDLHRNILLEVNKQLLTAQEATLPSLQSPMCFGVMPDWNPAEIIGIRPRPLALSLYRELVSDKIWADSRYSYGYRDMRNTQLITDFCGLPYIDVRTSFSSFIPRLLDNSIAQRLVYLYMKELKERPHLHDKIEFEIVFSCYDLNSRERLSKLIECGFSRQEISAINNCLLDLTERIIAGQETWRYDLSSVEMLQKRRMFKTLGDSSDFDHIEDLLSDCAKYGTLPFAGLARAGFIAIQLLNSLVSKGALPPEERDAILGSVCTVAGEMRRDFCIMSKENFLGKFGHLRPGTYDILSPRYDESPERYFDWTQTSKPFGHQLEYCMSSNTARTLNRTLRSYGFSVNATQIIDFIRCAVRGREWAKFEFTRNLSDALVEIVKIGAQYGISPEETSYLDIKTLRSLHKSGSMIPAELRIAVKRGQSAHASTCVTNLPSLIFGPDDIWAFEPLETEPNFITQKSVVAQVANIDRQDAPENKIAIIMSADPGYDWLFSRQIRGLITAYGGANSHMAIRALELGIPTVTGIGESRYWQLCEAPSIEIDGANRIVRALV
jgi:phosphohistidine swiveling domain-containing protein